MKTDCTTQTSRMSRDRPENAVGSHMMAMMTLNMVNIVVGKALKASAMIGEQSGEPKVRYSTSPEYGMQVGCAAGHIEQNVAAEREHGLRRYHINVIHTLIC